MTERTFVLVKPDGVRRGLTGEVIRRFEADDLKIVALHMVHPSIEEIDGHYPKAPEWIDRLGEKALAGCAAVNKNPTNVLGTDDVTEIGTNVRKWLIEYMTSAPLVTMVVAGDNAVERVRALVGPTMPCDAPEGTIRGDFSNDSPVVANGEGRVVYNIVHASETAEEATHEIGYWFGEDHLCDYERLEE